MNKQFEEWLYLNQNAVFGIEVPKSDLVLKTDTKRLIVKTLDIWGNLPFSMQWGVYLEFFDSVGIHINLVQTWSGFGLIGWGWHMSKPSGSPLQNSNIGTRTEAQQEAIKKAFQILEQ